MASGDHCAVAHSSVALVKVEEVNVMDWRHRAACVGEDPELFFPVGTTGLALAQIAEAKSVCHRCPVHNECLNWALRTGQDAGVWGGMSEDERRALKYNYPRVNTRGATTLKTIQRPYAYGRTPIGRSR